MKITKEDLKVRFDEYNHQYFNSVLPQCEFSVIKLSCLGRYMFSSGQNGKRKYRIRLTSDVNWTEETLRDVLIHEMIHHYVVAIDGCKGIEGSAGMVYSAMGNDSADKLRGLNANMA